MVNIEAQSANDVLAFREWRFMDRITTALLEEFCKENELTGLKEDRQFEHFACFLAVYRHHSETFDTEDVVVADTGIDGIAIIVNGVLVTDVDTVEELAQRNNYLDVTFVFVQADRSASFDAAKIGSFSFGVADFFKEKPQLPQNKAMKDAAEIMTAIYKRSGKFSRGNPSCRLYYVTTGKWVGDTTLETRRQAAITDLKGTGIFRDVDFIPVDADSIQKLYRQTKNAVHREFTFADRTTVPEIVGVTEAYIGLLPAEEFVSILKR